MHDTDRTSIRLRLDVSLHRRRLDCELAAGADPTEPEPRAARARQLQDQRTRTRLARALRRTVNDAERPRAGAPLSSAVPINRGAVIAWREGLLGLADALQKPGPVNPSGVARVVLLLTDGSGPLFSQYADQPLAEAVWWVADGLQQPPAAPRMHTDPGTPHLTKSSRPRPDP